MTLKERALHPFKSVPTDELAAIDERLFRGGARTSSSRWWGATGRARARCSSALQGSTRSTAGEIYVNGRVSTFIELGVGFNMELAGAREHRHQRDHAGPLAARGPPRTDEVLEFAELREFADLRLKNYSSGMLVRLAFAVMIQVDADVLLIDEVLAVGDAAFQQKCYDEFARLREEGRTVLLVTHDMGAVERFCDRALLLERGRVAASGSPHARRACATWR